MKKSGLSVWLIWRQFQTLQIQFEYLPYPWTDHLGRRGWNMIGSHTRTSWNRGEEKARGEVYSWKKRRRQLDRQLNGPVCKLDFECQCDKLENGTRLPCLSINVSTAECRVCAEALLAKVLRRTQFRMSNQRRELMWPGEHDTAVSHPKGIRALLIRYKD